MVRRRAGGSFMLAFLLNFAACVECMDSIVHTLHHEVLQRLSQEFDVPSHTLVWLFLHFC